MKDDRDAAAALAFELRETLSRGARLIRVESGPPLQQLTVLGHLQREGALTANDLAAATKVRRQSMSITVKSLEDAGLAQRRPDPDDRRRIIIEITPKGLETLENIFAIREDRLTDAIRRKLTEDERDELGRALQLVERVVSD